MKSYNVLLGFFGLVFSLIFLAFAAIVGIASFDLITDGGFVRIVVGILVALPAAFAAYIGSYTLVKTVVLQDR